jgi:hypothetical protein
MRRETSKGKKREYLKGKVDEVATNSTNKNDRVTNLEVT